MALAMKPFDTLKSFDTLKATGVSDQQAKALIEIIKEANESNLEHLATTSDLELVQSKLEQKIGVIEKDIAVVQNDIGFLKRLYFGGTAATLAAIGLLFLQRH